MPLWGPDARDPIDVCRPLGVEVYAVDDRLLTGWKSPEVAAYGGAHGMRLEKAGLGEVGRHPHPALRADLSRVAREVTRDTCGYLIGENAAGITNAFSCLTTTPGGLRAGH